MLAAIMVNISRVVRLPRRRARDSPRLKRRPYCTSIVALPFMLAFMVVEIHMLKSEGREIESGGVRDTALPSARRALPPAP